MKQKIKVRVSGPNYRKTKFAMSIQSGETLMIHGDTPGMGLGHQSTRGLMLHLFMDDFGGLVVKNPEGNPVVINHRGCTQARLALGDVVEFGQYSIEFMEVPLPETSNLYDQQTQFIEIERKAPEEVTQAEKTAAFSSFSESDDVATKLASFDQSDLNHLRVEPKDEQKEAPPEEPTSNIDAAVMAQSAVVETAPADVLPPTASIPEEREPVAPLTNDFQEGHTVFVSTASFVREPIEAPLVRPIKVESAPISRTATKSGLVQWLGAALFVGVLAVGAMFYHSKKAAEEAEIALNEAKAKQEEVAKLLEQQRLEIERLNELKNQAKAEEPEVIASSSPAETVETQIVEAPVSAKASLAEKQPEVAKKSLPNRSANRVKPSESKAAPVKPAAVKLPTTKKVVKEEKPAPMVDPLEVEKFVKAAYSGDLAVVKNAIEKLKINPATPNKNGTSALLSATRGSKIEIAKYLISKGAPIDQKDAQGMTPLMWSVKQKKFELIQLYLTRGADVRAKNSQGKSVMDQGKMVGDVQIMAILNKAAGRSVASP